MAVQRFIHIERSAPVGGRRDAACRAPAAATGMPHPRLYSGGAAAKGLNLQYEPTVSGDGATSGSSLKYFVAGIRGVTSAEFCGYWEPFAGASASKNEALSRYGFVRFEDSAAAARALAAVHDVHGKRYGPGLSPCKFRYFPSLNLTSPVTCSDSLESA